MYKENRQHLQELKIDGFESIRQEQAIGFGDMLVPIKANGKGRAVWQPKFMQFSLTSHVNKISLDRIGHAD